MYGSSDPTEKRRVLIAEDVDSIARLITRTLADLGFELAVAPDGERCLEMVRSFRPHLVILDVMMPKMHGIDVLKHLKESDETSHIPVIISTAKGFRTEMKRVRELGASDFILKPFSPKELREKVLACLRDTDAHLAPGPAVYEPLAGEIFEPRLDESYGRLRLWGTRGSIPVSGQHFIRHGGNTTCMTLEYGDELIIFDAGSGIRDLGIALAAEKPRKLHLFMTHTHWDHIQGFPFFAPAFIPGFEILVYGARGFNKNLESLFRGQLDDDYFPIQMENMDAGLTFLYLDDGPVEIGDLRVSWEFTQHPGATLGYKVETSDRKVAFIPDNEIFQGYLGPPEEIPENHELLEVYQPILDFLDGVDVLIHEAQYTSEEYRQTVRFGHSSVPNACSLAMITQPRSWIVVHHDPNHSDEFLQQKLSLTRQVLRSLGHPIEVSNGYDGQIVYL